MSSTTTNGDRNTGRTTQMLFRALKEAADDKNVLVVMAYADAAFRLQHYTRRFPKLVFLPASNIHWFGMQPEVRGRRFDVSFVDHYVYEAGLHVAHIQRELKREISALQAQLDEVNESFIQLNHAVAKASAKESGRRIADDGGGSVEGLAESGVASLGHR